MKLDAIKACTEHGLRVCHMSGGVVIKEKGSWFVRVYGLLAPLELAPGVLNGQASDFFPDPIVISAIVGRGGYSPYRGYHVNMRLCCFRTPIAGQKIWVAVSGQGEVDVEEAAERATDYLISKFENFSPDCEKHSWSANLLLVV